MNADDVPDSEDDGADDLFDAIAEGTASAVDPRQNREKLTQRAKELAEERRFVQSVLATSVGRRFFWNMLVAGKPFETQFGVGPNGFPQPEASWFQRGQQELAQRLFFSWQRLDREGVMLMQDEHDPRFAKPKPTRRRKPE